jgi:hypothetical protein
MIERRRQLVPARSFADFEAIAGYEPLAITPTR